MGAIIIPEWSWSRVRDALMGMKVRRGIRGELKWRYFAPGNVDVRNPMRHLDQKVRDEIRAEIYRLIATDGSMTTITAVCSASAAYAMPSVNDQDGIYHLSYKTVTERFQYYLQDKTKAIGRKEFGIIVCDHRGAKDDARLRAHHQMLLHSNAAFTSQYPNLVEGLFIHPSNLSIGIQLADMVAGAVWRKYEKNDSRWYDLMEPSIRRDHKGQIFGFGIIHTPKMGWV